MKEDGLLNNFIAIGKKLRTKVNDNEFKKITAQITTYSDNQLRDKLIDLCLMNNIDCQNLIELPRENCRKELLAVLMATV